MRKLNDINHSAVDSEVVEAIYQAAKILTIKATIEHAKEIWNAVKDKVTRHYGYAQVSEFVAAIDNGSMGKYGTFKTLNGATLIDWLHSRKREMEQYKPSLEAQKVEATKTNNDPCDPNIPKAILMRIKFDPGGESDIYSIDEIAAEIRKGNNIFLNRPLQKSDFEPIIFKQKISF